MAGIDENVDILRHHARIPLVLRHPSSLHQLLIQEVLGHHAIKAIIVVVVVGGGVYLLRAVVDDQAFVE